MSRMVNVSAWCVVCALMLTAACRATPDTPVSEAGPTLPPVSGMAQDLIVQLEDLPAGFALAGDEHPQANEYSVIYVRPDTLALRDPAGAALVGVIANLSLHPDAAAAAAQFKALGGLDRDSVEQAVREASGTTAAIAVEPDDVRLDGADEVAVFLVRYTISDIPLDEYRFRIRAANAIANLIVTAPSAATTASASSLRQAALVIADKQMARLNRARH